MADDAVSAKAAAPPAGPDAFAGATASLRETAKWFATALGATTTLATAGVSTSRILELHGRDFQLALGGGVLGILALLAATGVTLKLLTSQEFFIGDLRAKRYEAIARRIDDHAADLLPPEVSSLDQLLNYRTALRKDIQATIALLSEEATPARERDLAELVASIKSLDGPLARVTSVAHFLIIKRGFNGYRWWLLGLALLAILGFGTFSAAIGPKKDDDGKGVDKHAALGSAAETPAGTQPVIVAAPCGPPARICDPGPAGGGPGGVRAMLRPRNPDSAGSSGTAWTLAVSVPQTVNVEIAFGRPPEAPGGTSR